MLVAFIVFVLAVFAVFYVPGSWLLEKLSVKTDNTVSAVTLSLALGVSCFLIGTYLFSWFSISYLYLILLLPILFWQLPIVIKDIRRHASFASVITSETLILVVGVFATVAVTVGSGVIKNGNLVFYGINGQDGIYHSALIGNMMFQFPPSFPGLSHTMLRGYHILYDFMLARFAIFFGLNSFDLYFRFFSLFTAVFYGLSGLTLAYAVKMKAITRRIFLFLLFFSTGGEYLLFHWYHNGNVLYNSGIVQPAENIVDPSVLFSMALVFLLFATLFTYTKKKQLILPILFLGVLPGLKIYTGILAFAAAGIVAGVQLLKRKTDYLYVVLFAGLLAAAFYLPFNLGAGSLVFAPFLLFKHFMESDFLFSSFQWMLKLQVYEAHHNLPRIIYLYTIAVLLFFIPPLGVRLFSLVGIRNIFTKKFYTPNHWFWITFIGVGTLIPVLFIQSVGVFNTVQFYWLVWIALLIPTAYSFEMLIGKRNRIVLGLLSVFLGILCLTSLFFPLRYVAASPSVVVPKALLETTDKIGQVVPAKDDIMVVNRQYRGGEFTSSYSIPLIAALARRPVYYEPEAADFSQSRTIEDARKAVVNAVSLELMHCSAKTNASIVRIMRTVKVRYLLLMEENGCVKTLPSLRKVEQNGPYSLYTLL